MTITNHASHFQETRGPTLMQINVEGLTKAKREVIQHLTQKHRAVGILLQETHSTKDEQLQIHGFNNEHHSCNTSPQKWYCHICTIGRTECSRRDVVQQRSTTMDCCVYRLSNDNKRVQASRTFLSHICRSTRILLSMQGTSTVSIPYGVTETTQLMEQCSTIGHPT